MNQLDSIGINHAQHSRLGHKAIDPLTMGVEQAKQTGPMRQPREQGQVVPLEPAIESTIATAFERKQQGQRSDLARIQCWLRVFLRIGHHIIHTAKQFYDQMNCGHGELLSAFDLPTYSKGVSRDFSN
jgi:hypothetical protein